ncbi:MAG: hypothetical protein IJ776_09535 [Paludibacteraceae bacterium]|nr:hypothetical protein [Paludibacteraceae bacterium]
MMTQDYFKRMVADLKATYKDQLCEESLADIDAATTLADFIGVLKKYAAFLKYKNIPKADWARKWFGEYLEEANEQGCYLDQRVLIQAPQQPIVLFGDSVANLTIAENGLYSVTCQDNSQLFIFAISPCVLRVRLKDESIAHKAYIHKKAQVKIRKV